jgi:uncharacterized delta-60 repeat protein
VNRSGGPRPVWGKRAPTALSALTLLASLLLLGRTAWAAGGDLDPTFGSGGRVTTSFFGVFDRAWAAAVQTDGKIVAAGDAVDSSIRDFALARYNTDGSLDPTFGVGGEVTTSFFGSNDEARAVAIQGDGKIVVAGWALNASTDWDFALARYKTDGSLDSTFGTGGKVTTDFFGFADFANAVAIQGDSKIVVAGDAAHSFTSPTNYDFALARYNADGTLDSTFGSGGKVTTEFSGNDDSAQGLAIQGDGKIVAAGFAVVTAPVGDFALARYNPDGTLDTAFGTGGKVTTDFRGGSDAAHGVAIQGDGKIVAAGVNAIGNGDFALARYNADGTLDGTFGTGGRVSTGFLGDRDSATAVAIQGDGKIVAVGSANGTDYEFALARYNPDGTLDGTFGSGGKVTTDFFGGDDFANGAAIQADGDITAAGYAPTGSSTEFALARYQGAGLAITSVSPAAVGQGGTAKLKIVGSRFQTGATASVSGTGVSVVSTTFVETNNLTARISVSGSAPVGPRDVTVTNPSGDTATCTACLVIDAGPKPTSTSPNTGARGTTESVDVLGSGFQSGAVVKFGPGIVVNSVTFVSSGQITVSITISSGAATGSRTVAVSNPDGGRGTCRNCFTVT